MLSLAVGCVASYLVGSIPFSYLVARQARGIDLRLTGEGNVGARNVWHVVGKPYGALAGLLDVSKGLAARGIGALLGVESPALWALGFAVVLGHAFPVFLRGRGGKGAAAAMGFLLGLEPLAVAIAGAVMGLGYLVFRDFHRAVAPGMALLPVLWRWIFDNPWVDVALVLALLLLLGLKRLIDEPYMRKIKAQTGWSKS